MVKISRRPLVAGNDNGRSLASRNRGVTGAGGTDPDDLRTLEP
jgi:hypothetical protein